MCAAMTDYSTLTLGLCQYPVERRPPQPGTRLAPEEQRPQPDVQQDHRSSSALAAAESRNHLWIWSSAGGNTLKT